MTDERGTSEWRRAAIWISLIAAAFLVWELRHGLLLAFAAILTAILLRSFGNFVARLPWIGTRGGLAIATLAVLGILGTGVWLFGSQISSQLDDVMQRMSGALSDLHAAMGTAAEDGIGAGVTDAGAALLTNVVSLFVTGSLSMVEALVLIAVTAIYLAADPGEYRSGFLTLFRPETRERARNVLGPLHRVLVQWMLTQLVLMVAVGILSYLAVWAIGVPSALGLGLIAGLAEAVPYFGPFIGAAPAILVALSQGVMPALWTGLAFIGIHIIEGYFVAPVLQHRFVTIPPALVLFGIIFAEILFGLPGALLAAPLTISAFFVVKILYVSDTLHQPTELPKP